MLLYKISRTFLNRFKDKLIEDKFIIIYNKRDRALDIVFDLLVLYRSFRLNAKRY